MADWDVVVIKGQPSDAYRGRILGLAADLGTTTVALNLVELESGEVAGAASCPAGPAFDGGDVTWGMPGYDGVVESVWLRLG